MSWLRRSDCFRTGMAGEHQVPGDPTIWVELTEGIYRPEVWQRMSDNAGYAVCQRIKQGVARFAESSAAWVRAVPDAAGASGGRGGGGLDEMLSDAEPPAAGNPGAKGVEKSLRNSSGRSGTCTGGAS